MRLGPHKGRAEKNSLLPAHSRPSVDAAQDAIAHPGCKWTLLAHVQLYVHQEPQVLLCRTALKEFFCQSVHISRIALTRVQHLALSRVEPHLVHVGPLFKPVQVPLHGIPPFYGQCSEISRSWAGLKQSLVIVVLSLPGCACMVKAILGQNTELMKFHPLHRCQLLVPLQWDCGCEKQCGPNWCSTVSSGKEVKPHSGAFVRASMDLKTDCKNYGSRNNTTESPLIHEMWWGYFLFLLLFSICELTLLLCSGLDSMFQRQRSCSLVSNRAMWISLLSVFFLLQSQSAVTACFRMRIKHTAYEMRSF